MSQDFKLRFDQFRQDRQSAQTPQPAAVPAEPEPGQYEIAGAVRNLCLIWLDGRQMFFNYAYLVTAEYHPGIDANEIVLNFSGYTVNLKGYVLDMLFTDLLDHAARFISETDPRYVEHGESKESAVIEILVAKPE